MTKTHQKNVFRFWGKLNRFLPKPRRYRRFSRTVKGKPAIKDTIEALGVPHPEVDCICVDGVSVPFHYQTRGGQTVHVFANAAQAPVERKIPLKPVPLKDPHFILDAHLGKLVRHLRLLGFDCYYDKSLPDREIVTSARAQRRIILSRDVGLLKNRRVRRGYFVRATDPDRQIREVVREFALRDKVHPFSRCLACNGRIKPVAKQRVIDQLPQLTKQHYHVFYQCRDCRKVYWKGAHHRKLTMMIRKIQK
jgi:hypothetical protein